MNIEAFNSVVSLVLAKLYNAFPNEIELEGNRIAYEASELLEGENVPLREKLFEVAEDAINFLVEEGFIRTNAKYSNLDSMGFPGVRLTLRGFAVLGNVPNAVVSKKTLGAQISDAVNDGASTSLSELVSKALSGAVQIGIGAIGLGA